MTRVHPGADNPAVAAAIADLEARSCTDEPTEVVSVRTRVILRRGDRAWVYESGPDGIPILQPTGEKDGGQRMVRPPRMDV